MKASFTSAVNQKLQPATRSQIPHQIPQWVSEMGLEWLYLLLSKSEALRGSARLS